MNNEHAFDILTYFHYFIIRDFEMLGIVYPTRVGEISIIRERNIYTDWIGGDLDLMFRLVDDDLTYQIINCFFEIENPKNEDE